MQKGISSLVRRTALSRVMICTGALILSIAEIIPPPPRKQNQKKTLYSRLTAWFSEVPARVTQSIRTQYVIVPLLTRGNPEIQEHAPLLVNIITSSHKIWTVWLIICTMPHTKSQVKNATRDHKWWYTLVSSFENASVGLVASATLQVRRLPASVEVVVICALATIADGGAISVLAIDVVIAALG